MYKISEEEQFWEAEVQLWHESGGEGSLTSVWISSLTPPSPLPGYWGLALSPVPALLPLVSPCL